MPQRDSDKEFLRSIERNEKGQFNSRAKQFDVLKTKALEFNKMIQQQAAQVEALNRAIARQQQTTQTQVNRLTASFKKQLDAIRQQQQETHKLERANAGLSLSFLKVASASALAYAGLRKIQDMAEKKIGAALLGGSGSVAALRAALPAGIKETRALSMLGSLLQNPALRYGARGQTIGAVGKLAGATAGLGEQGNQIVADFVKALEPAAQRAFVQAVNQRGVQAAVQQFASGANIGLADELLNAIDMSQQAGAGTLDPMLAAALEVKSKFEELEARIEEVANALTQKLLPVVDALSKLSPNTILGIGAAGLALPLVPGLARGAGSLAMGAGRLAAANPLATLAAAGIAYDAWGAYQVGKETVGLHGDLQAAQAAKLATLAGSDKLAYVGERNSVSEDELTRLRGLRQIQASQIARYAETHKRGTFSQFFGADEYSTADKANLEAMRQSYAELQARIDALQASTKQAAEAVQVQTAAVNAQTSAQLDAAKAEADRLDKLRQQAANRQQAELIAGTATAQAGVIQAQLEAAQYAPFRNVPVRLTPEQAAFQKAIEAQIVALQQVLANIDDSTEAGKKESAEINGQIQKLRNESAANNKRQFDLQMADYSDKLGLMRLQYQIASIGPQGLVLGLRELDSLIQAMNAEIKRIETLINSIDQSTEEGEREVRKLRLQSKQLELERRQLQQQALQAQLDAAIGQAAQAGRFEKIIITKDQNLEAALRIGAAKENALLTGLVGDKAGRGIMPKPYQDWVRDRGVNDDPTEPVEQQRRRKHGRGAVGAEPVGNDPVDHLKQVAKAAMRAARAIEDQRDIEDVVPSGARHAGVRGGSVLN